MITQSYKPAKKKLFTVHFNLLFIVNLITALGYSMISSLVSTYAVDIGASLGIAGAAGGIYSISALAVRPLCGAAADRFNKKTLCIISTALISLSMAGYAVSSTIPLLFLFRILHGAAFGISGTTNMALVSEYLPEERLSEGLGYFGLGQVLSLVIGPAFGIFIRDLYGYGILFLLISVSTVAAVIILLFMRYNPPKKIKKEKTPFKLSDVIATECLAYSLVCGMFSLGNGIVSSFLLLMGEERGISGISLFFSVNAAVLFAVRFFIGKLADRKSLTFITNAALVLTIISMVLIGWAASLPIIMVAAAFKAVGQGSGQIALQSACIKKAGIDRAGVAASTFYIGADIGQGFGPILGGQLSVWFGGYSAMFIIMAIIMAAAMCGFNIYQAKSPKSSA